MKFFSQASLLGKFEKKSIEFRLLYNNSDSGYKTLLDKSDKSRTLVLKHLVKRFLKTQNKLSLVFVEEMFHRTK